MSGGLSKRVTIAGPEFSAFRVFFFLSAAVVMPLIESISPSAWTSDYRFGPFTNCYTFMTGFDQQFISTLGVTSLRPEDLGWTHFSTKMEWKDAVEMYFSPGGVVPQTGSVAAREGNQQMHALFMIWHDFIQEQRLAGLTFDYPFAWAVCFPMVLGGARLPLGGTQRNLLAGTGRTGR